VRISTNSTSSEVNDHVSSGGGRGRLAGARAPARKFFPASPFVKYLKF